MPSLAESNSRILILSALWPGKNSAIGALPAIAFSLLTISLLPLETLAEVRLASSFGTEWSKEQSQVNRDEKRQLVWTWQKAATPIGLEQFSELAKAGLVKEHE
jgi:hypothetical protein